MIPYHRYIRYLAYTGKTRDQIRSECFDVLRLPDVGGRAQTLIDQLSRPSAPNHIKAMSLVSTVDPKLVLITPDAELNDLDYGVKYDLNRYHRQVKLKANTLIAIQMWMSLKLRQMCCLLLISEAPLEQSWETFKLYYEKTLPPKTDSGALAAFKHWFWDFSGWTSTEVLTYLARDQTYLPARTCFIQGVSAGLFEAGLVELALDNREMMKRIRNQAYLTMDRQRYESQAMSPFELESTFRVLRAAIGYLDEFEEQSEESFEEYAQQQKLLEANSFATVDELAEQAQRAYALDTVRALRNLSVLSLDQMTELQSKIESGMLTEEEQTNLIAMRNRAPSDLQPVKPDNSKSKAG